MAARKEERTNEGLVAAAFSAMLQRPVITQQEYEERRHEPEFSTVEELTYERMSETVSRQQLAPLVTFLAKVGRKLTYG